MLTTPNKQIVSINFPISLSNDYIIDNQDTWYGLSKRLHFKIDTTSTKYERNSKQSYYKTKLF